MKIQPMIVVGDVTRSSLFYQKALGLESVHGGDEYEMLTAEGQLVLQLHQRDAHEHPEMWKPETLNGNGVLLWFRTDDFAAAETRIHASDAQIVLDSHVNPKANHHEIWFRDPDGYLLVVSDNYGDANE